MSWLFLTFGRIRFRLVANAPHGLDAAARLPQLLTQGTDVDIHCAAGAVELIAPDGVEQLVPGEDRTACSTKRESSWNSFRVRVTSRPRAST